MKGYRAKLGSGWIYYIGSGASGPIKIGWASNPWRRLNELQTGNPEELQMLALEPGVVAMEALRHTMFAADRLRGEWFAPSEALARWIAQVRWMSKTDVIVAFPERFDPALVAEYDAAIAEILAAEDAA